MAKNPASIPYGPVASARDVVPVTPGPGSMPEGVCRAFIVEGSGTVDIVTLEGRTVIGLAVSDGIWPIQCKLFLAATVTNIWALY